MPMQWNDQADARLFSNVLKIHVVKLDYHALAKAMGNGVTPKAISHRISKIKEKAKLYLRDHPYAFAPDYEEPRPLYSTTNKPPRNSRISGPTSASTIRRAGAKAALLAADTADDDEPLAKRYIIKSEPLPLAVPDSSYHRFGVPIADQKPLLDNDGEVVVGQMPPMGAFFDFVTPSPTPDAVARVSELMAAAAASTTTSYEGSVPPEVLQTQAQTQAADAHGFETVKREAAVEELQQRMQEQRLEGAGVDAMDIVEVEAGHRDGGADYGLDQVQVL